MDPFEEDDLEDNPNAKPAVFRSAKWRSGIAKRLYGRVVLILKWLRFTVLPRYGWRSIFCMALVSAGRLADAASFVVGVHVLTGMFSNNAAGSNAPQGGLVWAALAIGGTIMIASILGYLGSRLSVKTILDYQDACFVESLAILRHNREAGVELSKVEMDSITKHAPRMMARSLMQIIGACTSLILMTVGLVTCITLFPGLTVLVLTSLLLLSPLYVLASLHSTNIGHSIRLNSSLYSRSVKLIQAKWLRAEDFDRGQATEDIKQDVGYNAFRDAYDARLTLPARNHFLGNMTLAFVIALSFIWFAGKVDLNAKSITQLVSYLIALRLFAHGLTGIFSGVQVINTSLPFFLNFLNRDPRLTKLPLKAHPPSKKSGLAGEDHATP